MKNSPTTSAITVVIVTLLGAGLALAGSQHGLHIGPLPGFALAVALAFIVQWIVFIPSALAQSDRFFDATGSATYIGVTAVLLLAAPSLDARSVILGTVVIVWAARLGSFLLVRNIRSGGDSRFEEIKRNKLRFLSVWTVQGLWVSLTAAAAWIAITSSRPAPLDWTAWVGLAVWALGFGVEVIADLQKTRFKADPQNSGRFIDTGLWSVVRHPNYLGEILLWIGVLVIALPALEGWQWIGVLSPIFVALLLTKVSGIPLLEAKAEKKWGNDPDYRAYRARTPALIPGFTPRERGE